MACSNCRCPDICLAWPIFCEWAAEDPPSEVKLRHICARSAIVAEPAAVAEAPADGPIGYADPVPVSAAEEGGSVQPAQPVEYPPLAAQARNFVGAMARAATAVVTGQSVLAPREEVERRLAICVECEFYDKCQKRCKVCGCGGAKLHMLTEQCPKGKW